MSFEEASSHKEKGPRDLRGYRLQWKDGPIASPGRIHGAGLRPDLLGKCHPGQVAAMPIQLGSHGVALGDLFSIDEIHDPGLLEIPGSSRFYRLGAGMSKGTLSVSGDAGDGAGEGMSGGMMEIRGNAGGVLGAGMSGGTIHVRGNAADRPGGPPPDSRRGMTGGEIVILGNAGEEAGLLMRRGLLAIAGSAGSRPGYALLSGTIVVGKGRPMYPGLLMSRGTILLLDPSGGGPAWTPGLHAIREATSRFVAVSLILRRLQQLGFPVTEEAFQWTFTRFSSDHVGGSPEQPRGRGEILVPQETGPRRSVVS